MQVVLSISTIVAGGVGGTLVDLLANVWDLSSISELTVALSNSVPEALSAEELGETLGECLNVGREKLVEAFARKGAKDPEALVKEWIAAERDWQQFIG